MKGTQSQPPPSRPVSKAGPEVTRQPSKPSAPGESLNSPHWSGIDGIRKGTENESTSTTTTTGSTKSQLNPPSPAVRKSIYSSNPSLTPVSPLGLISELNLVDNSRNRKPIYVTQSVEQGKS